MTSFYKKSIHRARKEKKCMSCKETIEVGKFYLKHVGVYDEDPAFFYKTEHYPSCPRDIYNES